MDNDATNNPGEKASRRMSRDKTASYSNSGDNLKSDNIFKSLLNKPSMQKDFMREYLPEEATKKINFESIRLEKDSFVG